MEDTVNLLDIYNILKRYHHHRDKIYANLCSLLAERLHYKIMLVKNVDLEKKEITFYAKKYEVHSLRLFLVYLYTLTLAQQFYLLIPF